MAVFETEREVQVLAVFRQILQAPTLGPEQNFFDVGGSSLLAARLATRLRNTGVLEVPTSAIFAAPTARALTRYALAVSSAPAVSSNASNAHPAVSVAVEPDRVNDPVPSDQGNMDRSAVDRGARQRAAFARLRPALSPDAEEVR